MAELLLVALYFVIGFSGGYIFVRPRRDVCVNPEMLFTMWLLAWPLCLMAELISAVVGRD